jgi:hypothetical protein
MSINVNGQKKDLSYILQNLLVKDAIVRINRIGVFPPERTIREEVDEDYKQDGIDFSLSQLQETIKRLVSSGQVIPVNMQGKEENPRYFANIFKEEKYEMKKSNESKRS